MRINMKRIGVAGLIGSGGSHSLHILLGRRGKDPNKGLWVLPGGGLEDNESLEDAFRREIFEETGLELRDDPYRWQHPRNVIELSDRIILVAYATVKCRYRYESEWNSAGFFDDEPRDGSDLYDVSWFTHHHMPAGVEISPVILPVLDGWGFYFEEEKK
jgi:ADP-ribose pyrophosphatase YjhB (NUDIX family)